MPAEEKAVPTFQASPFSRRFLFRLSGASLLLFALLLGVFSLTSFVTFEDAFVPQLNTKARIIGAKVARDMETALDYGIPIDRMQGMEIYLAELLERNEDIASIKILDGKNANGQGLYSSVGMSGAKKRVASSDDGQDTGVRLGGETVATVRVNVRTGYVARQLEELGYDIITALLIALLVTFEMLSFFVHGRVFGPLHTVDKVLLEGAHGRFIHTIHTKAIVELEKLEQRVNECIYGLGEKVWDALEEGRELRAAQINERMVESIDGVTNEFHKKVKVGQPYAFVDMDVSNVPAIRLSFFVFMFAEELTRPFLPLLAQQYETASWLKDIPDFAAGLPIAVFMGVLAIFALISGNWVEKLGSRRMFLLGIVPAAVGYVGVFWAWDYTSFLISRGATAFGYAMVFVACQGYIIAHSTAANRASNMGAFVGAILVAGICGPAIGGILADRIGYSPTFLVSTVLVLMSAAVLAISVDRDAPSDSERDAPKPVRRLPFRMLLNRQFAALSFLCAIPAKMMLTGVIFLLVPLYLTSLEVGDSSIGRVIMLYGIAVVAFMPRAAAYADQHRAHAKLVIMGGLLSGLGGILLLGWSGLWAMTAVAAFVGLGQAMSISQQLALVQNIIADDPSGVGVNAGMGLFRFIERLGNMSGPLVAGVLAVWVGVEMTVVILAAVSLAGVSLFWLQDRIAGLSGKAA